MSSSVRCPSLAIDVSSFDIELGGQVDVTAGPVDLAPGEQVTYAWSAPAGSFADPNARVTTYRCPKSGSGPQSIVVAATRGLCTVAQSIVVICADPPVDGGPGSDDASDDDAGMGDVAEAIDGGVDGGDGGGRDGGDASGPLGCGMDPTIDEGVACNKCTFDNCTTLENAKVGVQPTAGCHHLASDAQRQSCQSLYCCIRSHGCVVDDDPTRCWCGTTDPALCTTGQAPANGPCRAEVEQAAGTTEPSQIALRLIDPTFPIGGAMNLAICRASFCADPPTPVCQGY